MSKCQVVYKTLFILWIRILRYLLVTHTTAPVAHAYYKHTNFREILEKMFWILGLANFAPLVIPIIVSIFDYLLLLANYSKIVLFRHRKLQIYWFKYTFDKDDAMFAYGCPFHDRVYLTCENTCWNMIYIFKGNI